MIKKTKSGKIDRRYLTKAEKEELDSVEALEDAQADNEDGYVKEEGEAKPLHTHPEPDYFSEPGMVTPPAREVNRDPDMSPGRKEHGHVEYVERGDEADGPVPAVPSVDQGVIPTTLPPTNDV